MDFIVAGIAEFRKGLTWITGFAIKALHRRRLWIAIKTFNKHAGVLLN